MNDTYSSASNIKSNTNRASVQNAITFAITQLKTYQPRAPPKGLVLYSGIVLGENGKEKKISISFEPYKQINTSLFKCDSQFHTAPLQSLLMNEEPYGFIIIDGNGTLFGTLCGTTKTVLNKFDVSLPGKTRRGGQSANRFARNRIIAQETYVKKVAELANQLYIQNDNIVIAGLFLAGTADFKNKLYESGLFDFRLQPKIMQIFDISYGGENGFNQAIMQAGPLLGNVKFIQEQKILNQFYDELKSDSYKYSIGLKDTLTCLIDLKSVEHLIIFENFDCEIKCINNVIYTKEQIEYINDTDIEPCQLLEYISQNYKVYGCSLHIVTDKTQEGSQFVKLGYIGAILRYANFPLENESSDLWED